MPVHRKKQVDIGTWGLGTGEWCIYNAPSLQR